MAFESLTSYKWPTVPVPLAGLGIRVDELAARLAVRVHDWDVEGLGQARGFGGRLPSGCVVLLEELQLAVKYHGAIGPVVYVDASELGENGPETLVTELLAALRLSRLEVVGVADKAARRDATELAAGVRAAQSPIATQGVPTAEQAHQADRARGRLFG